MFNYCILPRSLDKGGLKIQSFPFQKKLGTHPAGTSGSIWWTTQGMWSGSGARGRTSRRRFRQWDWRSRRRSLTRGAHRCRHPRHGRRRHPGEMARGLHGRPGSPVRGPRSHRDRRRRPHRMLITPRQTTGKPGRRTLDTQDHLIRYQADQDHLPTGLKANHPHITHQLTNTTTCDPITHQLTNMLISDPITPAYKHDDLWPYSTPATNMMTSDPITHQLQTRWHLTPWRSSYKHDDLWPHSAQATNTMNSDPYKHDDLWPHYSAAYKPNMMTSDPHNAPAYKRDDTLTLQMY